MIKFRQKEFWIGPALIAATSILGLKQGADAQKEQEEANEEAAREQRRHNRAMEKAAMTNPEATEPLIKLLAVAVNACSPNCCICFQSNSPFLTR